MKRLDTVVAEGFLFLFPFAAVFGTMGFPGFYLGHLYFPPYQLAAFALLLLCIGIPPERGTTFRRGGRELVPFAVFVGLVVLSVVFLKGLPTAEVQQLKNLILPMVAVIVAASCYLTSMVRARRLLLSLAVGITTSLLVAFARLGMGALGIRTIKRFDIVEQTGFAYIWPGVSGAFLFVIGFVLMINKRGGRLFAGVLMAVGGAAVVFSGTRAALGAVLFFPLVLFAARRAPLPVVKVVVTVIVVGSLLVALSPGVLLDVLGRNKVVLQAKFGADRLLTEDAYAFGLRARLVDWERMQYDKSMFGTLFGMNYRSAMLRSVVLSHPHNVFVWARLVAGVPAAIALALVLQGLISRAIVSYREASRDQKWLSQVSLFFVTVLFAVFITNSWVRGIHMLFGATFSLVCFLAMEQRQMRQREPE